MKLLRIIGKSEKEVFVSINQFPELGDDPEDYVDIMVLKNPDRLSIKQKIDPDSTEDDTVRGLFIPPNSAWAWTPNILHQPIFDLNIRGLKEVHSKTQRFVAYIGDKNLELQNLSSKVQSQIRESDSMSKMMGTRKYKITHRTDI
ncbi:MAG TPA: hypothetical protein ENI23_05500 [bacterium]|nr:hypothetical protein [bacterium]